MPRIPDVYLECAIYLYSSLESAKLGEQVGGSGLLVCVRSKTSSASGYIYAVTCSHVARDFPVVRVNTHEGVAAINYGADHWLHHPTDDLAAVHIKGLNRGQFKFKLLDLTDFINQEIIYRFDIGPGDDVFMVGRFITARNQQRNAPSVRFGNISVINPELVFNEVTGKDQESFAVEMRSIPGYSGSAVFVYTPFDEHHHKWSERRKTTTFGERQMALSQIMSGGPWLLGVGWGNQSIFHEVPINDADESSGKKYIVESNSGMMYVVPAWKIIELLDQETFREGRAESDRQHSENPIEKM